MRKGWLLTRGENQFSGQEQPRKSMSEGSEFRTERQLPAEHQGVSTRTVRIGLRNAEQAQSSSSDLDLLYHLHLQPRIEDLQLQIACFSWQILKIPRFAGQRGLTCVLHQRLFRGQVCAISCDRSPLKLLFWCPES